jgi:hypothetical protein
MEMTVMADDTALTRETVARVQSLLFYRGAIQGARRISLLVVSDLR